MPNDVPPRPPENPEFLLEESIPDMPGDASIDHASSQGDGPTAADFELYSDEDEEDRIDVEDEGQFSSLLGMRHTAPDQGIDEDVWEIADFEGGVPGHPSGTQLRKRLITPERLAEDLVEEKPSLLQRLLGRR